MNCYPFEAQHYLRGRHNDGCDDPECDGCQQCGERHCPECTQGTHLPFGENTCPECVSKVRGKLHTMVELYAALPDEAVVRGVHSEAANLHGPYADPEAFSNRRISILAGRLDAPLQDEDENHPVAVMQRWVWMLSEDYGDDYNRTDDLASLTDWVDRRLHRIANDAGQDFGQFRREIGKVVRHLEDVLHDGFQLDETKVPCLNCGALLQRRYATIARYDHHVCPRRTCGRRYEHSDFMLAKRQLLDDEGADRHVRMQDARDVVDRPRRTWNKWLRYWYVRSYRDPLTGQTMVWWPDVREIDIATPRRKRAA